ncbi:MAG: LysR family transcriptional regulator [Bradyrhizobium sp.]|jgi:hypothetical protein|nr:LysR family transcriptional regulator [Bradyrhizobium sp.]MDU1495653.1 LysR family transcriptional regulator [Bradyrhizobium sp.]MDU1667968.1 LysR family transcriptional regulator [Bradyrhizobium sp.]MDU1804557.1 LysR family transcriptional regulator [Bradyrhizobium sp.]MDU2921103.1 LysR family transcriptional regulator [Bradyrhizobium sp.]MDU3094866.1 LysR family transcriptional regulator [Bradyrhizobium sp.]
MTNEFTTKNRPIFLYNRRLHLEGADMMERRSLPGQFKGARPLGVDFDQLRHAITAADYGSFRQAAEVLSTKQSTLSRSIQLLECSLGTSIFDRSSGGVRATPAGRYFLRIARSIIEQLCDT